MSENYFKSTNNIDRIQIELKNFVEGECFVAIFCKCVVDPICVTWHLLYFLMTPIICACFSVKYEKGLFCVAY